MSFKLTKEQSKSINDIKGWFEKTPIRQKRFYTLGGLAGTGKSTILSHLKEQLKLADCEICYACYTGKASLVLQKKGLDANTIHSLIYYVITDDEGHIIGFQRREALEDRPKLIVVDEASMVSKDIHEDLMQFNVKILYVGDFGQIPPIKGNFNLMEEVNLDSKLTEIHRQAKDSGIIEMAMMARNGQKIKNGEYGADKSGSSIKDLDDKSLLSASQIICGRNNTREELNKSLRKLLKYSGLPKRGEKLIITKNNRKFGAINGMQVLVIEDAKKLKNKKYIQIKYIEIDHYDEYCDLVEKVTEERKNKILESANSYRLNFIVHDNKVVAREFQFVAGKESPGESSNAVAMQYGYAITAHKAQGSQWDEVVVIDESFCFRDNKSKWLYTAITRAVNKVIVID